jgi:DNA-binding NarL/FixJ family response regulator
LGWFSLSAGDHLLELASFPVLAIVDDHLLFAEGLKGLLEARGNVKRCLVYRNGYEALQKIPLERPDLALVDVHLPDMDGVELVRRLQGKVPQLKAVMLTVDDTLETALRAITAGAMGYLVKSAPFPRILQGIWAALQGDIVIASEVAPLVIGELKKIYVRQGRRPSLLFQVLTPREREILRAIVEGKNNAAIAEELCIAEKTVKNHLTNILTKLNIENRVKLIVFALKEGFLEE